MGDAQPQSERLTEVLRLATSLAYRILNKQLLGSAVPPNQTQALVDAARVLHENGMDWPPGVTEALRRLSETTVPAPPVVNEPSVEENLERHEDAAPISMGRGRRVKHFIKSLRKWKG